MGKLVGGFILGFLACVWTYGLDPTEAVFGFSHKLAAAHDHLQEEYRVDARYGHKGQYPAYHRGMREIESVPGDRVVVDDRAYPAVHWLNPGGGPPMM